MTTIRHFTPFPGVGDGERWREVLIMGLIPTFALPSFIYFNTELRLNGLHSSPTIGKHSKHYLFNCQSDIFPAFLNILLFCQNYDMVTEA